MTLLDNRSKKDNDQLCQNKISFGRIIFKNIDKGRSFVLERKILLKGIV